MNFAYKLLAGIIVLISAILIGFGVGWFVLELTPKEILWQYIWGPVVADASQRFQVAEGDLVAKVGYNIVNTLFYMGVMLFILYIVFIIPWRYKEKDVYAFIFSLSPVLFYGAMARVLEDSNLFISMGLSQLFITPLVYLQSVALLFISLFLSFLILKISGAMKPVNEKQKNVYVCMLVQLFSILLAVISFFIFKDLKLYWRPEPLIISCIVFLVPLILIWTFFALKRINWSTITFSFCSIPLAIVIYLLSHSAIEPWHPYAEKFILVPTIYGLLAPILIVIFIYFIARFLSKKYPDAKIFTDKLNLFVIFSQALDACASYVGIAEFGYVEKHVLPSLLVRTTGSPFILIIIKIFFVLLLVYLIDKDYPMKEYPVQSGSLKLMIMFLGFGPGLRNFTRVLLGV